MPSVASEIYFYAFVCFVLTARIIYSARRGCSKNNVVNRRNRLIFFDIEWIVARKMNGLM